MPELPEVETVVRDLRPQLEGRKVLTAWAGRPGILRHPEPEEFGARLPGLTLARVGRHGKFILVELDGGRVDELLVLHLGMTGRLGLAEPEQPLLAHTHLRLGLSSGVELRMTDYRRFGRVMLGTGDELRAARVMPALGPEPYEGGLPLRQFSAILGRSRRPIKALLLDQSRIAGLGNIYCDEACFRAGVRPTAVAQVLGAGRRRRLHVAINEALDQAVHLRGSSIDDYRDGFGEKGLNQRALHVYGRAGLPCTRCGRELARTVVAGRTTVFCRSCQR
ncbi:MAG: bifunctional DNA-formamidopyrimidine glycosylase/DNA-(apurinic or apyrimidinic site) lyase [Candidatus Dormibacteria bacterium]